MDAAQFQKIERVSLSDRVAGNIREMIVSGQLRMGDKLPGERELSARFGVSRACVREAVHALESVGLLEVRMGDGTYVASAGGPILEHLSWAVYFDACTDAELRAARSIIEPEVAALAARNATGDEVERLRDILRQMREAGQDARRAAEFDYAFHVALADAAHNSILQRILVGLQWILKGYIAKRLTEDPKLNYVCYNEHRDIFDAVAARDPERARQAMARSVCEAKLTPPEAERP